METTRAAAVRILVADDERDIRDGAERILQRMGYDVLTAARGDDALKLIDASRPEIVLLDLKMPGKDGMEVLAHIRQLDPNILAIVITGYATVDAAIEAMKRGAYDFVPKPFEPDQLRIVINRAAERVRLTREADFLEQEKRRTLSDLGTEKSRIHTIVESLPDGVLVTNASGHVVQINPACRQLLSLGPEAGPGKPVATYLPDEALCALIMDISQGKHLDYGDIPVHEFALGSGKYLRARGQPVLGDRKECLGAVVNFVDITALKILDRLKSEFVSKVSHELRSPLSTIHEQLATVIGDLVHMVPAQDQHILTRAKEKTKGLISLINDLLDMSRIDEGVICREPRSVCLLNPSSVVFGMSPSTVPVPPSAFRLQITPSRRASTLQSSCSSSYQLSSMALAGHSAAQMPHPWHSASSMWLTPSSLIRGTWYGQERTQIRQAAQTSGSTRAVTADSVRRLLDRKVIAREAAAWAWPIDSVMSCGLWVPQMKSPSVAISTGRSLTCASMKCPPGVRASLTIDDNSSVSEGTKPALRTRRSASA